MKLTFHTSILVALALQGLPAAQKVDPSPPVIRRGTVMGAPWNLKVEGSNRQVAIAASELVVRELSRAQQRLSNWLPDSELSQWNRSAPGRPLPCSPKLAQEMAQAEHWRQVTRAAFSPLLEPLVQAWDLRGQGRIPSAAELSRALAASDPRGLTWQGTQPVRGTGALVASGGFGKGAAMDAAAATLAAEDSVSFTLNLGGQILVHRRTETLNIAHPEHRDQSIATWIADSGSLATSGHSERGLLIDGCEYSHILDGRSGQPAPDFGSVTVWCRTAIDADCLSTALFVLGPEKGLQLASSLPNVRALFVENTTAGLRLRATQSCKPYLQSTHPIQWFDESTKGQTSPTQLPQ